MELARQLQPLGRRRGRPLPGELSQAPLGQAAAAPRVADHQQRGEHDEGRERGAHGQGRHGVLGLPGRVPGGAAAADHGHGDGVDDRPHEGRAQGRPPPAAVRAPAGDGVQARQGGQRQGRQAEQHGRQAGQQSVEGQRDGGDDEGDAHHAPPQRLGRGDDDRQGDVRDVDRVDAETVDEGQVRPRDEEAGGAQEDVDQGQGPGRVARAEHLGGRAPVGRRGRDPGLVRTHDGRSAAVVRHDSASCPAARELPGPQV